MFVLIWPLQIFFLFQKKSTFQLNMVILWCSNNFHVVECWFNKFDNADWCLQSGHVNIYSNLSIELQSLTLKCASRNVDSQECMINVTTMHFFQYKKVDNKWINAASVIHTWKSVSAATSLFSAAQFLIGWNNRKLCSCKIVVWFGFKNLEYILKLDSYLGLHTHRIALVFWNNYHQVLFTYW